MHLIMLLTAFNLSIADVITQRNYLQYWQENNIPNFKKMELQNGK